MSAGTLTASIHDQKSSNLLEELHGIVVGDVIPSRVTGSQYKGIGIERGGWVHCKVGNHHPRFSRIWVDVLLGWKEPSS